MDKLRKLRRYQRKDYSEVVDFPVEIVGRDGTVRRYSFEASVRLYQRRIASAASRYDDADLVRAEVDHCRRRIEQLRASYLRRFGWSGLVGEDRPLEEAGDLAGEVACFLRRVLPDPLTLRATTVSVLDRGERVQTYCVQTRDLHDEPRVLLLYLYRFATDAERDAFFRRLSEARLASGPEEEHLLGFRHAADFGIVLTGPPDTRLAAPGEAAEEGPEAPVGEARRLLEEGDASAALARIEAHLRTSPYDRAAYRVCLAAAGALGRPPMVEVVARWALHYFPGDAEFRLWLGLARMEQGDLAGARERIRELVDHPRFGRLAMGITAFCETRPRWRRRWARRALRAGLSDNPDLRAHLRRLLAWERKALWLRALPPVLLLGSVASFVAGRLLGGTLLLAATFLTPSLASRHRLVLYEGFGGALRLSVPEGAEPGEALQ